MNPNARLPNPNSRIVQSSSRKHFSSNPQLGSRFKEPIRNFDGFEPHFQSSPRQQTAGGITVTEAPQLYTTKSSLFSSTSTSLPFLDTNYDYKDDFLYEDYADYYNQEVKLKKAEQKKNFHTGNISSSKTSSKKNVDGNVAAPRPKEYAYPKEGKLVTNENDKTYDSDEYEYYYEYVYEDDLDDYLDDPLPTGITAYTAVPTTTTTTTASTSKFTPETTSSGTDTTSNKQHNSPRRSWTAPTRRPHHQTTPSTASNAPSYDEYYDDYYYKEYDTYPSNDLLDSKWKGYTIADQKRKDAHRNDYESASVRTTPTTTTTSTTTTTTTTRTTTTSRPTTARTTASTTSRSTSSSKEYPYLKPDNYNQIKPFGKEDCEDFLCDIKDTDYPL